MGSESVHIVFFPYLTAGHMIPMVDLAKLFSKHGVRSTIVTTPANAATIQSYINRAEARSSQLPISIEIVKFPSLIDGLPEGCESGRSITSVSLRGKLLAATALLRQPFHHVLAKLRPDCVVTDSFLPWTFDVAFELGVPRIVFDGGCLFSTCAAHAVRQYQPHQQLPTGDESFVIPGLPHTIEMVKSQIPDMSSFPPPYPEVFKQMNEKDARSYGMVVNSFYELEPDYIDYYKNIIGGRTWAVGPICLCAEDIVDKSERSGITPSIDADDCVKWLNSKAPSSVLYVCFGSVAGCNKGQIHQLAIALEASDCNFIWVVANNSELPEGYEENIKQSERGLIIRGWAPQTLILSHAAVGCFMTHCGWNSTIESICYGVPMVTWPLMAEQFYNEKLVVDVLKIGCSVGNKEYVVHYEDRKVLPAAQISSAVGRVMGDGEEATEMREKAKVLAEMAKKAVEGGGSSFVDLDNLVQELLSRRNDSAKN